MRTASGTAKGLPGPAYLTTRLGGRIAVDQAAESDTDEDKQPDTLQDVLRVITRVVQPLPPCRGH